MLAPKPVPVESTTLADIPDGMADVIVSKLYHAVGYTVPCNRIVSIERSQVTCGLDTVHPGHAHVQQHDVRLERRAVAQRLGSVGRLAHDVDLAEVLEHAAQTRSRRCLVVDDKRAQSVWQRSGGFVIHCLGADSPVAGAGCHEARCVAAAGDQATGASSVTSGKRRRTT